MGNVGHARRVSWNLSSSLANKFTLHRKSHKFPRRVAASILLHHQHQLFFPYFFRTRVEFLSRYDQKASTLFLIFICIFSSLFLESFEATQQTFFVNQDVTNEERETNTDAERKDKRRALLPTVSAVVSRLVKCNVRAVISMLVPKKAFIVLTSRALWKCYRF